MVSRTLRTPEDLDAWIKALRHRKLPTTVSAINGITATEQQRRTYHMWFGEISQVTGADKLEVKGECKMIFGLPIMERDRPDWVEYWEPVYSLGNYEARVKIFAGVPMTSLFKKKQSMEFMTAIQRHFRGLNVHLTDPEALKYEREMA